MDFDGQVLDQMLEQLLFYDNLEPAGCEGSDENHVKIPLTPDVSQPLDENSADTMRAEIL